MTDRLTARRIAAGRLHEVVVRSATLLAGEGPPYGKERQREVSLPPSLVPLFFWSPIASIDAVLLFDLRAFGYYRRII
ncbi:MAG: hypothetical protein RR380_10135 [Gordonibacter sp.]